ncbi:MAG TPA: D-alanyl-D-alanine carboxypeptidase/D-alanyl-D-alanine-endopeptidase [Longimicrobiaceae bacterium]|jgi:D-alanyl-D-alanine carboxypeptidase/D-alanyl-D-alanine-endopeptidase (penicillin-binding protein 4)|nr:D-alanyl-D-alanine carboxypeptidase/D-alanyl-D-alanine-endopeptidase [Longimicrobiaceae bacterium]
MMQLLANRRLRAHAALAAALLGACTPPPAVAPAPVRTPAAVLAAALDSIFEDTAFAHAQWGVAVRSLDRSDVLYARNAGKLFVPASNMKIVTGSAALEALGPAYRFRTRVEAHGRVAGGVLDGDLVVRGGGDPSISARFQNGDATAVFRAWADSLRAHGVTRITGRVIGDDDVFDDVALGRGWAWDDADADYSAEISGLELNEGAITVRVSPGAEPDGQVRVQLSPATGYAIIDQSRVRTAARGTATRIDVTREPLELGLRISGQIAADTPFVEEGIAVHNPTLYFVTVLRETLARSGIRVDGAPVDADDVPPAEPAAYSLPLFTHVSPPLAEILPGFLKPSQNQIGEMLLKTLGRELRGEGSARAGGAVVDSLHRLWGVPPRELSQADGSGLSRYDLVAPDLLAGILTHMTHSSNWQTWYAALPIAGVDGTLAARMQGTPLQANVHAKTGTLSGVRSLSGYLTTAAGERIVFSTMVNNHTLSARDADRLAEAALLRIYTFRR